MGTTGELLMDDKRRHHSIKASEQEQGHTLGHQSDIQLADSDLGTLLTQHQGCYGNAGALPLLLDSIDSAKSAIGNG